MQRQGRRIPQGRYQHTQHRQRRHHQCDPGNRHRIGQQADQRYLAEQQQREGCERDGHRPLLARRSEDAAAQPPRPGLRLGRAGREQHTHGDKAQPETRLHQRPRVGRHDHRTGQQPYMRPRPVPRAQPQQGHGGQHADRALRRHAPAAEQRIGRCEQHAAHQCRALCGNAQAEVPAGQIAAPPEPAHQQGRGPREHGDVQARDAELLSDKTLLICFVSSLIEIK